MTRSAQDSERSPIPSTLREVRRVASLIFDDDGTAVAPPDPTLPHINGYELTARLGAGGSGEVFDAIRSNDGVRVAIKVLRRTLGSGSDAKRIWREIDLLADLRHPSVPRVLAQGTLPDARPYIVFEHIAGTTLDNYAGARGLSRRERVELLAKTAEAVQSLHDRGIIHRDIKPSNIIINVHRDPVIIDLGVASLTDRSALETLTADGAPLGTPAFMSPEQARGERASITTRSDVYALGATGYALLTGATPHDMNTTIHEAIRRVASDAPRAPRELDPTIDGSLDAVLRKAVAPDPAQRYPSALELALDLRRWLSGEPVDAKRPTPWQRAARWAGRHPVGTGLGVSLTLGVSILASSLIGSWWLGTQPYKLRWDGVARLPARLYSRSGNLLREWPERYIADEGVMIGGTASRPGKPDLIIIAEAYGSEGLYSGLLSAYSFADYSGDPVWVRGVGGVDISKPEHIKGSPPEDDPSAEVGHFVTGVGLVADIFPDVPGDEIVATHYPNPWSATAIRVYSASGEILYEAWHDGQFTGVHWLADERVVIFSGVNSEERYNHSRNGRGNHVPIVMAIKPVRGTTDRLITAPDCPEQFRPYWYKTLPAEVAEHLRPDNVQDAVDPDLRDSTACVNLKCMADTTRDALNPRVVSLYIRADGTEALLRVGDPFRHNPLFDIEQYRGHMLIDMPIN